MAFAKELLKSIPPQVLEMSIAQTLGAPPHSWQVVAASGSGIGFRGMVLAAKTLALTALDLMTKPETVRAAREEFAQATQGKRYVSPLPEGARPH